MFGKSFVGLALTFLFSRPKSTEEDGGGGGDGGFGGEKGGEEEGERRSLCQSHQQVLLPFPLSPFPRDLRLERYRRHKLLIAMTGQGGKERGEERGGDAMRI